MDLLRSFAAALLAFGCGGVRGEAPSDPAAAERTGLAEKSEGPAVKPALAASGAPREEPVTEVCPRRPLVGQALAVRSTSELGVVAGKRWVVATLAERPVLLHLGPAGALTHAPLSRWTEDVAPEGEGMRLFFTGPPRARWSRVELADRDAPREGADVPLAELVPGEYPKGVASDGTRALVSLYRSGERGYEGDTFLLEIPSGRRRARAGVTVWTAQCLGGRCFGVATENADPEVRALVEVSDAGARRVGALGRWNCSGAETWRQGESWLVAWSERGAVGVAALDLRSGALVQAQIPASEGTCPSVQALAVGGRRGVVVGAAGGGKAFVPVGPGVALGAAEALPAFTGARQIFAEAGSGALVLDFTAAAGMVHGPEDPSGMREYHEVWSFSGRHGLLRRGARGWELSAEGPLPHDGTRGEFSRGFDVYALTRPGHAGALMVADAGESAYYPLLGPCAEAR